MKLELNKDFELFVEAARHVYKNSKGDGRFGFPNYLGFKKAGKLSSDLIDILQDALDHKRYGAFEKITERSFVEACLSDCFRGDFYNNFVKKNQKLYQND
jgi:hypothetical protein